MARKKGQAIELRYYDKPIKEPVMALLGVNWIRRYGIDNETGKVIQNMHFHNMMEIGLCHHGKGDMLFQTDTAPYGPGTLTVIPENCPHNTMAEAGTESFFEYIYLDPARILNDAFPGQQIMLDNILQEVNRRAYVLQPKNAEELAAPMRMMLAEMKEKKALYCNRTLMFAAAFLLGVARMGQAEENRTGMGGFENMNILSEALAYIDSNYAEPIKVRELAAVSSMSETNFRRVFDERMGMTPGDYINLVRITKACRLLQRSDCSMEEIAVRIGYDQVSTFNRNFRKIMGDSPYHWKRNPSNFENTLVGAKIEAKKGWV